MKKLNYLLLVLSFTLISISVKSQNFSLGGKIGIDISSLSNWSELTTDDSEYSLNRSGLVGLQVGAVANYSFNNYLALQAELLFQQKGESYKMDTEIEDEPTEMKFQMKVGYLTIPILLRGSLVFGNFRLSALAGPYLGIGVSAKYKAEYDEKTITGKFEFGKGEDSDGMTKLHRIDFGLSFGLVPAIKLGPGELFLDLRYDLGLVDLSNPDSKPDGYISRKNRNVGISLGYLVKLGD